MKMNDIIGGYRSNFPGFWEAFIRYVASTQVMPDKKKNLESIFHHDPQIKSHLTEIKSKGHSINDVLDECIQELRGAYVARDDKKIYSIVSEKQLPRVKLPSGGDYDIPMYDLLIKNGTSRRQGIRTYNALKRHIFSKDAGVLINVGGTMAAVLQGDSSLRNSILTVGGAKEFSSIYGLNPNFIRGLGENGYNLILNSLSSIR